MPRAPQRGRTCECANAGPALRARSRWAGYLSVPRRAVGALSQLEEPGRRARTSRPPGLFRRRQRQGPALLSVNAVNAAISAIAKGRNSKQRLHESLLHEALAPAATPPQLEAAV